MLVPVRPLACVRSGTGAMLLSWLIAILMYAMSLVERKRNQAAHGNSGE